MRPKGCGSFPPISPARLGGSRRSGFARVGQSCAVLTGAVLTGALCLALPQPASAQNALPVADVFAAPADMLAAPLVTATDHPPKPRPESEITVEGLVSSGNSHILRSVENAKRYDVASSTIATTGATYSRRAWT